MKYHATTSYSGAGRLPESRTLPASSSVGAHAVIAQSVQTVKPRPSRPNAALAGRAWLSRSVGSRRGSLLAATRGPQGDVTCKSETVVDLSTQLDRVGRLADELAPMASYSDKLRVVLEQQETVAFLQDEPAMRSALESLSVRDAYLLLVLIPLGQRHVLQAMAPWRSDVCSGSKSLLLPALAQVEEVYDVLGGLVGYQLQCLQLLNKTKKGTSSSSPAASLCTAANDSLSSSEQSSTTFHVPKGLRLNAPEPRAALAAKRAVMAGIRASPRIAEIWPVGGCADRLGLRCPDTGDALPAALLSYQGRPLLEQLIRDTTAREYLHWRAFGGDPEPSTPIALMTSAAKGNHQRIENLCRKREYWGRGRDGFHLVCQPDVPVLESRSGRWLVSEEGPVMKPGGHGVIWKLMLDAGVYTWLRGRRRSAAVLRQISNPMAATDTTMLALIGRGQSRAKSFGFASCERRPGAAEGVNVLKRFAQPSQSNDKMNGTKNHHQPLGGTQHDTAENDEQTAPYTYSYAVTNIEYTEFEQMGIPEETCSSGSGHSAYPANANILYADVAAVEAAVRSGIDTKDASALLPGLTFNAGKRLTYKVRGQTVTVPAGRLECTMQNIAEQFPAQGKRELHCSDNSDPLEDDDELPTFLVTNARRKVTSSAKRAWAPGSSAIQQTPQGSFYDLQLNAAELLGEYCGVSVPAICTVEDYLANGPDFIFLFNPALGPLWRVIGQKLRGGRLGRRSELQLEIAEADIQNLDLEGSLLIEAENVVGHMVRSEVSMSSSSLLGSPRSTSNDQATGLEPRLVFGDACGRVRLQNVSVRNAGIDWSQSANNSYWEHRVKRHAACRVVLHGRSEFEAQDVTVSGSVTFEVPDGYRMVLTAEPMSARGWRALLEPLGPSPSWRWEYTVCDKSTDIWLRMHEQMQPQLVPPSVTPGYDMSLHTPGSVKAHPNLMWLSDQRADDSLFCSML